MTGAVFWVGGSGHSEVGEDVGMVLVGSGWFGLVSVVLLSLSLSLWVDGWMASGCEVYIP